MLRPTVRRCFYKKIHYLTFDLDLWCIVWNCYIQQFRRCIYNTSKYIIWPWLLRSRSHETLPSAFFIMWHMIERFRRRCVYKKIIIWPCPWGQGHKKYCPVPSISCDLCICKVWSCCPQWSRRKCIYKKIHFLTLTLGIKQGWVMNSPWYLPVAFTGMENKAQVANMIFSRKCFK